GAAPVWTWPRAYPPRCCWEHAVRLRGCRWRERVIRPDGRRCRGTRDAALWPPVGRWMPVPRRAARRIPAISGHTPPLEQPGTGDAGGLNVYVVEVAKRMAARGVEVEIFTRAVSRDAAPVHELVPGVLVRHVPAGPFEELDKADLPAQLCEFTLGVLRTEAAYAPGRYDLVHGHYWLSGHVGAVAKERWGVPLVQSMHTLGRVKNAALARGDMREPEVRLRGESDVVASADRLVANTDEEARQLAGLYGADPAKIWTINPGVDLSIFRAGPGRGCRAAPEPARRRPGDRVRGPHPAAEGPGCGAAGGRETDPGAPGSGGNAHRGICRRPQRHRPGRSGSAHRGLEHAGDRGSGAGGAALPAVGTGRLVPGRHRGHGAVVFGVVRPGRGGGGGLRHPGDRGGGGVPAHGRSGRRFRPARRGTRPGRLRGRAAPAVRLTRTAGPAGAGRGRAREPVRLGQHGGPP